MSAGRVRRAGIVLAIPFLAVALLGAGDPPPGRTSAGQEPARTAPVPAAPAQSLVDQASAGLLGSPQRLVSTAQATLLIGVVSLAPAALLMVTAFVRISIVLALLRQAIGSPQVPGNQVMSALALLLTLLVMKPAAEEVYRLGIEPYTAGRISAAAAWQAGTKPIKGFMIEQIYRTGHEHYLRELYDRAEPPTANRVEPASADQLELRIVAPAFLLSELTTALLMGFAIYLPFLVVDLVVSAVLVAMGLFMLPPSLVALPIKLIVFVLADGWMLVADMLLRSFGHV
jgi:flagellar biosynthetic protein FliP